MRHKPAPARGTLLCTALPSALPEHSTAGTRGVCACPYRYTPKKPTLKAAEGKSNLSSDLNGLWLAILLGWEGMGGMSAIQ